MATAAACSSSASLLCRAAVRPAISPCTSQMEAASWSRSLAADAFSCFSEVSSSLHMEAGR